MKRGFSESKNKKPIFFSNLAKLRLKFPVFFFNILHLRFLRPRFTSEKLRHARFICFIVKLAGR